MSRNASNRVVVEDDLLVMISLHAVLQAQVDSSSEMDDASSSSSSFVFSGPIV